MRERLRSWRVRLLVFAALAIAVGGCAFVALDSGMTIWYYRVIGPNHIVVGVQTGRTSMWTRVASTTERDSAVTVEVRGLELRLAGTEGDLVELDVTLARPLGSRQVVDASDGRTPQRLECPPTTGCS